MRQKNEGPSTSATIARGIVQESDFESARNQIIPLICSDHCLFCDNLQSSLCLDKSRFRRHDLCWRYVDRARADPNRRHTLSAFAGRVTER